MILFRSHRARGFTIIELLVVIAIIILVAGLVVGLGGVATSTQRTKRAEAERAKLVTLIDAYKSKFGFYPPQNTNSPDHNTLLYELAGARRVVGAPSPYTAGNPGFETKFITSSFTELLPLGIGGVYGILNAPDDVTEVKHFLKNLKPDQYASLTPGTLSLVVPVEGPGGKPNPWNYLTGANATNNPASYDLWVDIIAGGKTVRIANWKE